MFTVESLWLSTGVRFLIGTHNVIFVPNSLQEVYNIYLNFFTELKIYHAFNLFDLIYFIKMYH